MKTSKEYFDSTCTTFLEGMRNTDGKTMSWEASAMLFLAQAVYLVAVAIFYKDR